MTDAARSIAIRSADSVDHSAYEWSGPRSHGNTVGCFFNTFKRGMKVAYQHVSERQHRYLAEFDFRYPNRSAPGFEDQARAESALVGVKGEAPYLSADWVDMPLRGIRLQESIQRLNHCRQTARSRVLVQLDFFELWGDI